MCKGALCANACGTQRLSTRSALCAKACNTGCGAMMHNQGVRRTQRQTSCRNGKTRGGARHALARNPSTHMKSTLQVQPNAGNAML